MDRIKNENLVVMGIYKTEESLEKAVNQLKLQGFRNADISALLPSSSSTKEFAISNSTKTPEAASIGATTGAAVGGILGWLVGAGTLALPGLGALVAAGPIMAALAGAGAGGATGGLAGALVGMGMPEYEAQRYEGYVKDGGLLLSVHADNQEWQDKAEAILEQTGAESISSTRESDSDSHERIRREVPQVATKL